VGRENSRKFRNKKTYWGGKRPSVCALLKKKTRSAHFASVILVVKAEKGLGNKRAWGAAWRAVGGGGKDIDSKECGNGTRI